MGSNMAEAHPVGFQWVMEGKARGATVIHIDPRFTRTSAVADMHVPLRAGTDNAFLGGVINYILTHELDFREYVLAFTNAPFLVDERYRDTEDLDGLFSGYDPATASYDPSSWHYEGTAPVNSTGRGDPAGAKEFSAPHQHGSGGPVIEGAADGIASDPTLQHPRCVYQILKRHFARYTPEMVEATCGTPKELFLKVCRAWTSNSLGALATCSSTNSGSRNTTSPSTRWPALANSSTASGLANWTPISETIRRQPRSSTPIASAERISYLGIVFTNIVQRPPESEWTGT